MSEKPSPDEILEKAVGISDPDERSAYLDEVCAGNAGLRAEIDSLLAAYDSDRTFLDTPATPAMEPPGEKAGDMIGTYKLLEILGEGGFGRVWMAEQTEPMKRRVALKIIKLGMDTSEVLARFEAERQVLAKMDHPNIATIHDGGATETGRPYFVMELVNGAPITEYCDANKLPPRGRIDLFRKVCDAVQHAHLKGVIHRDLKPSNILVTVKDGNPMPKVIDFGVAKALDKNLAERTLFTRLNQRVGTPEYMSPEQAGLGNLDIDTRSDVYTLGVILYELLIGRTPFGGRELREWAHDAILRRIREEDPPKASTRLSSLMWEELTDIADHRSQSPGKLAHLIHGELDWILLKVLERDRTRRYESSNALAKDLERYCEGTPISAAPPDFNYKARKLVRKHWKVATLVAVVLSLVLAGSLISTVLAVRANTAEKEATDRLRLQRRTTAEMKLRQAQRLCENGEIDKGLVRFSEGLSIARLAHEESLAEACALNLAAWLPETHTLVHMFPHPKRVSCMAVSPDGKLLASACRDGFVRFWNLATGQLAGTLPEHPAPVNALAFGPAGTSLVTGCADGVARLWRLPVEEEGTVMRTFVHAPPDADYSAAWGDRRGICSIAISKNGSRLATGGYDGWIHVWSRQDATKPLKSRKIGSTLTWAAFDPHEDEIVAGMDLNWKLVLWNWKQDFVHREISTRAVSWHFDCNPENRRFVVGTMQGHFAQQYDPSTGEKLGGAMKHHDAISWVEYSSDGSQILTASADHTVRAWNTYTGAPVGSIMTHPGLVTCCTWSPGGGTIITACEDKVVRVWRTARAGPLRTLLHGGKWVRNVDISSDGSLVVTGLSGGAQPGGNMHVWDVVKGDRINSRFGISAWDSIAVFDVVGPTLYAAGGPGAISRYDAIAGDLLGASPKGTSPQRLAISFGGDYLASAHVYGPGVRIWRATTLEQVGKPLSHGGRLLGTAYSQHIKVHNTPCFAFGPSGDSILTGNSSGDVQLWRTATCSPIGQAKRHSSGITALAFASDGKTVAVGGADHRARLLDWEEWRPVGAAMEHAGRITALAFTPGRPLLLTSSVDGTARAWHVPTGMPVGPVFKHAGIVNTLKCSSNGQWAATAADDGTAKIWQLPDLDTVRLKAVEKCVPALTGVTTSGGNTVRVLSIKEWEIERSRTASLREGLFAEPLAKLSSTDSQEHWIQDLIKWAQSESPAATAAIEGTLVDEISWIRAVELLRRQGTPEAAKSIGRLYATGTEPVRLRAISALQQMRLPAARQAVQREIVAFDDFTHESTLNWEILRPDPSHVSFDKRPGTLTIRAQDGEFYGKRDNYRNVYLLPNPAKDHDFQLTMCIVGFTPSVEAQQAAMLCWTDPDNYLKLNYEFNNQVQLAQISEHGGRIKFGSATPVRGRPARLWIRLTRVGDSYSYASSRDGERFITHRYHTWAGGKPEFVGLTAMAPGRVKPTEIDVSFDFFEVAMLPPPESESPPAK